MLVSPRERITALPFLKGVQEEEEEDKAESLTIT